MPGGTACPFIPGTGQIRVLSTNEGPKMGGLVRCQGRSSPDFELGAPVL
jgi:hypothetical protein